MYRKQGAHAFFLINIEPIIYLLATSIIRYIIVSVLKSRFLKGKDTDTLQEADLSFLEK